MPSVPNPRILLCAAGLADAEDVRGPLIAADYAVVDHPLGEADPNDLARHDLILLDGHAREAEALKICKRFRLRLGDDFVPLLFILGDIAPAARLACLEAGADAYLVRPFAPGELLAQVQAMICFSPLSQNWIAAFQQVEALRINFPAGILEGLDEGWSAIRTSPHHNVLDVQPF